MAQVRIDNLSKQYSPNTPFAIKNLDLDVPDGEFLALLGPSGCGKTTTLRCIAGLERQTEGDIFIGDRDVTGLPAGERDIAFVFQFYALYPHLNVFDNISFPLRAQRINKEEVARRVDEVARLLQIDHILKRKPTSLPSGEQQRVALGRAIIRRPQVFLMDEPLTNLDASLRTDMRVELKRLQADIGTTMVYVTHDQTEALSMAHRIAIMDLGVLQQVGTPLEVYNKPKTLFVAGFIGTPLMNFIECQITDSYDVAAPDGMFRFSIADIDRLKSKLPPSWPLIVGIRAEDISISASPDQGQIQGQVTAREPLGDEIIYEIEVGQNNLRVKTEPTLFFETGDNVGLSFAKERMHLFDATTEKVLEI